MDEGRGGLGGKRGSGSIDGVKDGEIEEELGN